MRVEHSSYRGAFPHALFASGAPAMEIILSSDQEAWYHLQPIYERGMKGSSFIRSPPFKAH